VKRVIIWVRVGDGPVDLELVTVVEVIEALDLAVLQRDQLGLAAFALHRLPGLGELDLLHPIGRQERDPLALEPVRHR
jgi:hypothetical protein